ncbi:MAG: mercuric reductase [Myxococcota bacterium]
MIVVPPEDEHNRALVAHTHPPDWANPAPATRYDLVVVGGGTGGLVSAFGAAGLGGRVALVEEHLLGGDCLVTGCVPSKGLLAAGHMAHAVRSRAADLGVRASGVDVDAAAALTRMRRLRAGIAPHDSAARLRDAGVDVFLGHARFVGPRTMDVGGTTLRFERAVLATGGKPFVPPVPGLRELGPHTSETLFGLEDAPGRLVVLGGGPIGCEMAQAFRRLGSEVVLVQRLGRLLPKDDPDAADVLLGQLRDDGVEVLLEHEAIRAGLDQGRRVLRVRGPDGAERDLDADEILVAAGRRPNLGGMDLEAAGVAVEGGALVVDERLRTTNERVFAAGDVAGRWQFTHTADAMARMVLKNAFFFGRSKVDRLVVPWATYTEPEVAHLGATAAEAEREGMQTLTVRFDDNDRAILEGETDGFARMHVDGRGRVRGATVVHPRAGDLIGEASLAITTGLKASTLSDTIHPYPTTAEVWRMLGDQYQRTRLKPWVQRLLAWRFRWLR